MLEAVLTVLLAIGGVIGVIVFFLLIAVGLTLLTGKLDDYG